MKNNTTLNKNEFVEYLRANTNFSTKVAAEEALDCIVDGIKKALSQKHKISLIGFGMFEVKERKARDGRNPKTGEKIKISSYNQPTFRAGAKLKSAVNGAKKSKK